LNRERPPRRAAAHCSAVTTASRSRGVGLSRCAKRHRRYNGPVHPGSDLASRSACLAGAGLPGSRPAQPGQLLSAVPRSGNSRRLSTNRSESVWLNVREEAPAWAGRPGGLPYRGNHSARPDASPSRNRDLATRPPSGRIRFVPRASLTSISRRWMPSTASRQPATARDPHHPISSFSASGTDMQASRHQDAAEIGRFNPGVSDGCS